MDPQTVAYSLDTHDFHFDLSFAMFWKYLKFSFFYYFKELEQQITIAYVGSSNPT